MEVDLFIYLFILPYLKYLFILPLSKTDTVEQNGVDKSYQEDDLLFVCFWIILFYLARDTYMPVVRLSYEMKLKCYDG